MLPAKSDHPQVAFESYSKTTQPNFEQDQLPPIGSSEFFPALLTQLRDKPSCPPLDPSILQSILLCIVAGDKHLILRTNETDVGSVSKVAASTLASVFGYSTHRLKIKPPPPSPPDPQGFLRSLFLPYTHRSTTDSVSGQRRSPSKTKTRSYTRSYSYPHELGYASSQIVVPTSQSSGVEAAGSPSSASGSYPRRRHASASPSASFKIPAHPQRAHLQSETLPHDGNDEIETQPGLELPRALVVSGLEHAGMAAHRALIQVLAERRVVLEDEADNVRKGTDGRTFRGRDHTKSKGKSKMGEEVDSELETGLWNLPKGFILVYVCPLDPWERPAIHKSLLDRFAMSITVSLHPELRHGFHSSFSRLSALRSSSNPVLSASMLSSSTAATHQTQEPHLPYALIGALRTSYNQVYMAQKLALYISDLFSAARHHQQMDGTLLTVRAKRDADSLIKACRVMGLGGEVNAPLTTRPKKEQPEGSKADNHKEDGAESDERAADRNTSSFPEQDRRPVLDISESDIARIVPRVISHRLRVLDSPEDEIHASAFVGAFQPDHDKPKKMFEGWVRNTVKDILVEILSEV